MAQAMPKPKGAAPRRMPIQTLMRARTAATVRMANSTTCPSSGSRPAGPQRAADDLLDVLPKGHDVRAGGDKGGDGYGAGLGRERGGVPCGPLGIAGFPGALAAGADPGADGGEGGDGGVRVGDAEDLVGLGDGREAEAPELELVDGCAAHGGPGDPELPVSVVGNVAGLVEGEIRGRVAEAEIGGRRVHPLGSSRRRRSR